MDQGSIAQYISKTFAGLEIVTPEEGVAAGDTFFMYDPEHNLEPKQKMPFATIVTKDYGDFDRASNLDRAGVFRLNIGVSRGTFHAVLGAAADPAAEIDYAALDQLLPHPVYATQSWVCVLNPSAETFASLHPLLAEAYGLASRRAQLRATRAD